MNRVESIYLEPDKVLSSLCHLAKNLYNEANYIVRQEFVKNGKWIRYYDLCKQLIRSENYRTLPSHTAQQALRNLDFAWKSFFNSIKAWKTTPDKYRARPRLPHYLNKDGEYVLAFTKQQIKVKNGVVKFPKKMSREVKTRLNDDTKVKWARIVPQGVGYQLEIVCEKEVPDPPKKKPKRIAGIDLGVNNLVTVATNIRGVDPIVVKGGIAKSWNQWYNKESARLKSVYDHQKNGIGKRLKLLGVKRKHRLKDYFHKTSRAVIEWCSKNRIDTIVIGRNKG